MQNDVLNYVSECRTCQEQKYLSTTPTGLLQPIPIPAHVWDKVTLDFIQGQLCSKGYDTILVVIDCLSKYVHFKALKHPFTTVKVAEAFLIQVVCLHGIP